jgi:AmmeMemoRadiSam system protein A
MAPSPSPEGTGLPAIDDPARRRLVHVAREAVRVGLTERRQYLPDTATMAGPLRALAATFVTLRRADELLGCIGTMEPVRPLADDVARNAASAAFADPRLPAVTWEDFHYMRVKISVLGRLVPLAVRSVDELAGAARPGIDGLLVADGQRRGTFLPSVWAQVSEPAEFIDMLWQKAGLAPGTWSRQLQVFRYETLEFGD